MAAEQLQQHLQTPDVASMHWSVTSGWILAEAVDGPCQSSSTLRSRIAASPFWSVSLDEATAIDKTSWLCCHIYIIEDFKRIPIFVKLAKVTEAPTADALLRLLVDSILSVIDGLDHAQRSELASKQVGLGSDGASVLTGEIYGLIAQLRQKHAPFVVPQHDAGTRPTSHLLCWTITPSLSS